MGNTDFPLSFPVINGLEGVCLTVLLGFFEGFSVSERAAGCRACFSVSVPWDGMRGVCALPAPGSPLQPWREGMGGGESPRGTGLVILGEHLPD